MLLSLHQQCCVSRMNLTLICPVDGQMCYIIPGRCTNHFRRCRHCNVPARRTAPLHFQDILLKTTISPARRNASAC